MSVAPVVRLVSAPERLSRSAAAAAREAILAVPDGDLPVYVREAMLHTLQRLTSPAVEGGIWPGGFTMISREQTAVIWAAIEKLPSRDRPRDVDRAFKAVLLNLRTDTGEVMLTRDQLSDAMGCSSRKVSEAMSVLVRLGVIERQIRRVEGMRGPGMVAYFINPHAAWNGKLSVRESRAAAVEPPLLSLMQGGRRERVEGGFSAFVSA